MLHLLPLLRDGVVIAQRVEGHAQQGHGQHHHTGGEHKLPPIQAAGDTFDPLAHAYFTSNL